jgi:NAD+ diphosphatase
LGTLEGKPYLTFNIDTDAHLPTDWKLLGLRELYGQLDEEVYGLVGYAAQILQWSRNSRFCPACATETVSLPETWGRKCPNCGYNSYPPVSPAILVLVHDNDGKNVLMAHKPGWGKRYGLIAGFVEPGESLEDCVRREAVEEAGIEVDDIVYMGNQPWPYPHQLMVGFSARYIGGTTQADQVELDDVRWFNRDDLPLQLPPPFSLAYMMISQWLHLEAE